MADVSVASEAKTFMSLFPTAEPGTDKFQMFIFPKELLIWAGNLFQPTKHTS